MEISRQRAPLWSGKHKRESSRSRLNKDYYYVSDWMTWEFSVQEVNSCLPPLEMSGNE